MPVTSDTPPRAGVAGSASADAVYRFARVSERDAAYGVTDLSDDPRIALLAVCIASQQKAGFGTLLDLREIPCPECEAPGFNTGWGVTKHTCGAEWHGDANGTAAEPCNGKKGA